MNFKYNWILSLFATVTVFLATTNSCAVSGLTNEATVNKLPEPLRANVLQLMREERLMLARCSEASAQMAQASAIVAEGCGLEKESQKLRAYANSLNKSSSREDQRKYVVTGSKLLADVNSKLGAATHTKLKSKEKFKQGYILKNSASDTFNQVAKREVFNSLQKVEEINHYLEMNRNSSDPMVTIRSVVALNYAMLPLRFVAQDFKRMRDEAKVFDEQCKLIGKKYSIQLPAPVKNVPVAIPKGIV